MDAVTTNQQETPPTVICGNCKTNHPTVAEVRACYAGPVRTAGVRFTGVESPVEKFNRLADLLPPGDHNRYSVHIDGVWKHYQVDRPTEGKWAGRTFVSVCSSDETWPIRPWANQLRALEAIVEAGPEKALADYGLVTCHCGICHRTLTDPESIARGIGPICWGRL